MATLDELEASLRAKWDRDTLEVYADHLQSLGELRGELIVIDLRIEEAGPLPELVERRKEILAQWLRTLPPGKVQHGFLDVDATGADPVGQVKAALASPAAPFIRTLAAVGAPTTLRHVLGIIADAERPALVRVVFRQWAESEGWAIDTREFDAFAKATPNLDTLEVDGYRVFAAAVHPAVRRLRVSGWNAFESLWGAGAGWRSLDELDFAFVCHLGDQQTAPPPNRELLSRARCSAVRSLDLSRNEPGQYDPIHLGGSTNVFKFLRAIEINDQLHELRMPSVLAQHHLADLRIALGQMPKLEHLAVRAGRFQEQLGQFERPKKISFFP